MKKKDDFKNFFIGFICVFVFGLAIIPYNLMDIYMFLACSILIFYFDDSGIRMFVVKKLPKDFPLIKYFSRYKRKVDGYTEYYKTATFLSLLLMIPFRKFLFIFVGLAILFPVLSLIRYIKHNEEISFASQKNEAVSSTALTIIVPAIFFTMTSDNQIFNRLFWILAIGIVLLILITFLIKKNEYRKKKSVLFLFILFISLFSVGTISIVNIAFDFGERVTYRVRITDKTEYHGRTTDYVLVLSPWDELDEEVSMSVSQEEYEEYRIGEWVNIIQADGALNMKWYYLETEE